MKIKILVYTMMSIYGLLITMGLGFYFLIHEYPFKFAVFPLLTSMIAVIGFAGWIEEF